MTLGQYLYLARTHDTDLFANRVRYSELDGRKRTMNKNQRIKLFAFDYVGLWLKIWMRISCLYHWRLNRFHLIYRYIEQSLAQNLEISNIFHVNHRLPAIIKALKLGEKLEDEKAVIYLSPDEVLS